MKPVSAPIYEEILPRGEEIAPRIHEAITKEVEVEYAIITEEGKYSTYSFTDCPAYDNFTKCPAYDTAKP